MKNVKSTKDTFIFLQSVFIIQTVFIIKKSTMATSKTISETQATYYPPSLMPPFMGAYPPTKLGVSLFEGGKIGYFQNYRNETLSKLSVSFLKRKYITLLTLFVSNRRFVRKKNLIFNCCTNFINDSSSYLFLKFLLRLFSYLVERYGFFQIDLKKMG